MVAAFINAVVDSNFQANSYRIVLAGNSNLLLSGNCLLVDEQGHTIHGFVTSIPNGSENLIIIEVNGLPF